MSSAGIATDPSPSTTRRDTAWLWLVSLVVAGLAAYLPALAGVFTFDDYPWILHNSHVGDLSSYGWQRRPITLLTFAANLALHGPNPVGFHVINIALHLANTVLVFLLLRKSVLRAAEHPWIAAIGAAVFLLHPAQTEAVTYISGRATSLMTFWLLVTHLAAIRSQEDTHKGWTAISVGAVALAVASKEIAIAYPAIWIGWLVAGRGQSLRASARAALPHLVAAACLGLVMVTHPGYRQLLGEAVDTGRTARSPLARLENRLGLGFCFNYGLPRMESCLAARVEGLAGLVGVVVLPQQTSIDHGRRPFGPQDVLVVGILAAAAVRALRTAPSGLAAGTAWIVAALLPTHLLAVRSDPVADRLLYLPMVGIGLIASSGAATIRTRVARSPLVIVGSAVLLALAVLTLVRNTQYQSEVALWEDAVRKAPHNARARVNLGYAYELSGDLDKAEHEYRSALDLNPQMRWADEGLRAVRAKRNEVERRR